VGAANVTSVWKTDVTSVAATDLAAGGCNQYNPFGGASAEQCIPAVEKRLELLVQVQDKLRECLAAAQEAMATQFNRHVRDTPRWHIGDEVWLNSRQISTTRPCPKLGHRWLGPFPICSQVSTSAYKLTHSLSMKGVHPVFHVSVLQRHNVDTIDQRRNVAPEPVVIEGKDEWEVKEILDCRKRGKTLQYLVSWKDYGPVDNSWEPETNLNNCHDAVTKFNTAHPEAYARHRKRRRRR
jgi:hypothetical protein